MTIDEAIAQMPPRIGRAFRQCYNSPARLDRAYYTSITPREWISRGIKWVETPQGHKFWQHRKYEYD